MNKIARGVLLSMIVSTSWAQIGPLNSFSNSGGSLLFNGASSTPAHIGVIGQPITGAVSGTLVVSSVMYSKDPHPPVISFDPKNLTIKLGAENNIQYQATDNNQIVSNKLFYRPIGKVGTFESADVTTSVGSTFSKAISSAWYDHMGMEYYLEVKDKENTTRHPAGSGRHFVYTIHPEPQVPTTLLSYGKTKNNYRIISIPFATSSPITQLFDELGPSDKTKYRIYKYNSGSFKEYPSFTTLSRGEGFLILMSDALSDVVLSMPELQAPPNNRSDLYKMTLQPGWNLIGNPYTIDINWDDVLMYNNNPVSVGSNLKVWTESGQFANVKDLQAYQGAFVFLNGSQAFELTLPFKGQQTPSGGRHKEMNDAESWNINLILHEGVEKNSLTTFGMNAKADLSFDSFDDLSPPSLHKFPVINFLHPEHSEKYFTRDIVPQRDSHSWLLEIPSTNDGDRSLDWSIPDLAAIVHELFLYDIDRNAVVNMKTQSHYSFPSHVQNFKIFFGQPEEFDIHPAGITVLPPYPNPVGKNETLTFSIGLPKTEENFTVQLDLFDAVGRSLYRNGWDLTPGLHEINVPSENSLRPNLGEIVYYKLDVGHTRFSGKIIYNSSR